MTTDDRPYIFMNLPDKLLPPRVNATLQLWYFGLFKVPLIFAARPAVIEIDEQHVVIRIRIRRKLKNHFDAMYFPVLAIGADCAVGLLAVRAIRQTGLNISFIFRDFHAEFYRRATDDVEFRCNDSEAISELVSKAASCDERVEQHFETIATVPSESDEPIARLKLTLSLKRRPSKSALETGRHRSPWQGEK